MNKNHFDSPGTRGLLMSDGAHIVPESLHTPLSIKLPYDASLTGAAAVISHLREDQRGRFVAFASKYLTLAKWSCMEIERGSLSCSQQFKPSHQCYVGNGLCWLKIISCTFSFNPTVGFGPLSLPCSSSLIHSGHLIVCVHIIKIPFLDKMSRNNSS